MNNIKQNPFSLYDFLGYLVPGAIFIYMILAAYVNFSLEKNLANYLSDHLSFSTPERYIPLVFCSYVLGHILSFLSSITIERYSIWTFGYPSKYLLGFMPKGFYAIGEKKYIRYVLRTLVWLFLLPISIFDLLLGRVAGLRDLYAKTLDPLLVAILKKKLVHLMKQHANIEDPEAHGHATGHDFFRYAYHYAVEKSPNHGPKMQNYVALYGFLRTLTLIAIVLFWTLVWYVLHPSIAEPRILLFGALTTAIASYLLFMGFVKFYRRFSLEALMAFAVTFEYSGEST